MISQLCGITLSITNWNIIPQDSILIMLPLMMMHEYGPRKLSLPCSITINHIAHNIVQAAPFELYFVEIFKQLRRNLCEIKHEMQCWWIVESGMWRKMYGFTFPIYYTFNGCITQKSVLIYWIFFEHSIVNVFNGYMKFYWNGIRFYHSSSQVAFIVTFNNVLISFANWFWRDIIKFICKLTFHFDNVRHTAMRREDLFLHIHQIQM